jgi:hypothetical protein
MNTKLFHIITEFYNFNFTTNTFADKKHENAIKNILLGHDLIQIEKEDKRWKYLTDKKNILTEVKELINDFIFIEQPFGTQKTPDFIICVAGFILWIECKSGKTLVWNSGYPKRNILVIFSSKKTDKTTIFFGQFTSLLMNNSDFEKDYEEMDKFFKNLCKDKFNEKFKDQNFELYFRRMLTDKTKYDLPNIRDDFYKKTIKLLEGQGK